MWIDSAMVRKVVRGLGFILLFFALLACIAYMEWRNWEARTTERAFENCQADRERLGSENAVLEGEGEACRSSLKECKGAVKVLRSLLDERLRKEEP
jgi:hypothetical protein